MKSKLILITVSCILSLGLTAVRAQTDTAKLTSSHLEVAERFLVAAGIYTKLPAIIETMVNTIGNQTPENERNSFKDVMRKFMNKYFTWDNLKGKYARMFAAEFTEDELKQMIEFFNTPVGRKYNEKSVLLFQKGAQIGQDVVMGHRAELEQMIKDATPSKNDN